MKALRPTNIPFPSTGSFTRASTATYIEDGILKTAAINEPRWQDGKLLLEGEATNLLLYSQDLTGPTWSGGNRGPSPNFYAGSVPFWYVSKVSANPYEYCQGNSVEVVAGRQVEGSCAFLAGSSTTCEVALFGFGGSGRGADDDSTVEVIEGPGYFSAMSGSGGELVNLSATVPTVIRIRRVQRVDDGGVCLIFYPGGMLNTTIGASVQATRFQMHIDGSSLSYIPTTTAAVTRAADIITGTGLIYTNATDARPFWSNTTTYSVGQVIRYNNTVYESLQNTNLNKQPDTNPTWWLNLGADNISAAFDGKVGTKTTATDKLRMIIKPGTNIDSVGYIEATASTISTSAVDEDYNTVYSYKSGLNSSVIEDWYDYFFLDPLGYPLTQVVHQGINSLDPNLAIGVEIVRSGTVELGVFVTGQSTNIGKTQYGLRAGIVDYSKKEADEFGNVTIVERTYSKRLEGDVYVYNYDLNKVQRFLYNVRATPVLWIASDDAELAEVSNVYGFYKDFSTTIAYPDVSMCSLQIEGLT